MAAEIGKNGCSKSFEEYLLVEDAYKPSSSWKPISRVDMLRANECANITFDFTTPKALPVPNEPSKHYLPRFSLATLLAIAVHTRRIRH